MRWLAAGELENRWHVYELRDETGKKEKNRNTARKHSKTTAGEQLSIERREERVHDREENCAMRTLRNEKITLV